MLRPYRLHQTTRAALEEVLAALGTTSDRGRQAAEQLQGEVKRLTREVSRLKVEGARAAKGEGTAEVAEAQFPGGRFVAQQTAGLSKDELRQLADAHRDRIKTGVVVIASKGDDKLSLVVAVTKDLVPRVHAGQIVKQIAPLFGGSGGGRPDFAEAGGKDPAGIPGALAEAQRLAEAALKS